MFMPAAAIAQAASDQLPPQLKPAIQPARPSASSPPGDAKQAGSTGSNAVDNLQATPAPSSKPLLDNPDVHPYVKGQAIMLRPIDQPQAPAQALTLYGAVRFAEDNYPRILQLRAEVTAAQKGVTLQKVKEYNPTSMMTYEQVVATHNKLTQILFSDSTLPPNPGPGLDFVTMNPSYFTGAGFILDWAPIDFGLHKARIQESKTQWQLAKANYAVTQLDVAVQAASSFLAAVVAHEQVKAFEANVKRFEDFSRIAHALADSDLRPQADASLADAQLANAQNDLIRARLQAQLMMAEVANSLGVGGQHISIDPEEIGIVSEPPDVQSMPPLFDSHPFALQSKASILTQVARRRVLAKEYYPVFRWLAGMNFRGTSLGIHGQDTSKTASGFAPGVPNWNVGLVVNFPFMDILRIQAEKKVVDQRIAAQRHSYEQVLQNLKTQDVQARARVNAAVQLAANMPVQVAAALKASRQAQARYEAGLGTLAQVTEANQVLADSRVKEAVAKVGVWQALLAVASVHGDLKPFVDEAQRMSRRSQ